MSAELAHPRLELQQLGFPRSVLHEGSDRGLSDEQLRDLIDLWWELHWYPPTSLAEVVDGVLL